MAGKYHTNCDAFQAGGSLIFDTTALNPVIEKIATRGELKAKAAELWAGS